MSTVPARKYLVRDARIAWKALNGVFVIYKQTNIHFLKTRFTILSNLCRDLNEMKVRPLSKYVSIEGDTTRTMKVVVRPNYEDHPLVAGARYQMEDIKFSAANFLEPDSSGVLVCGINDGTKLIHKLREARLVKCYRLKGMLGMATDNYFKTGKTVEKSTYDHVRRNIVDKICASMQSSHQKKMFEVCGVDIQSQAAYELAAKGLLRPANKDVPILYEIKCINFEPPEFTLEIICINEYEEYFKTLIHDLGLALHTTATCTQIRCIKVGLFGLEHTLLSRQWDLESIVNNIAVCKEILQKNSHLLKPTNPNLVNNNA